MGTPNFYCRLCAGFVVDLNLCKCVLISASTDLCFPGLGRSCYVNITDEKQGFKVLGVPMGGKKFVKKALEETARKVAQFCEEVIKMEHPQMDELIDSVNKLVMDSSVVMLRTPCSPVCTNSNHRALKIGWLRSHIILLQLLR